MCRDMSDFEAVPIVEVTSDNIKCLDPAIRSAISLADFIAIDCELSGLGERSKINTRMMTERYENVGTVAKTRSIVSLGLSMFQRVPSKLDDCAAFKVQTFNLMTLCSEDYIVEPGSIKFLVQHGFDFATQYSKGLPFYRGNDRDEESEVRSIFAEIVRLEKPIVLHNGFIDLVFMYQNFYAQLPVNFECMLADLASMFPGGIYDTKYISEYVCRLPSTFLEFQFKTLQRRNVNRSETGVLHIAIEFPTYPEDTGFIEWRQCRNKRAKEIPNLDSVEICDCYANHGACPSGDSCTKSHDIDRIVLQRTGGCAKKRKLEIESTDTNSCDTKVETPKVSPSATGCHRAGFDAFMTGFSFLVFLTSKNENTNAAKVESSILKNTLVNESVAETNLRNRIYIVSHNNPLVIRKSNFANNSAAHVKKIQKLKPSE